LERLQELEACATATANTDLLRRAALRKTAGRLLPILGIAYFFNYLDRTSVGIAALTMNKDLGLTASEFGWGAGILFFGYCAFEVPSSLALYRFGARRWLARIMISWGLAAAATAFATGPTSFYAIRFILGAAEAGFFPGVIFYLALWFPSEYRTRMIAWFMVAMPVSSLIGGPVSGMLLQLNGLLGIAGWKWLFIIEGLPACVMGIVVLTFLVDGPAEAGWLTPAERDALKTMLAEEPRDRPKKDILTAIADVRVIILTAITFGLTVGSFGMGVWLPLILKEQHVSNVAVGFLSAVPYLFATIGMMVWAWIADRAGGKLLNLALGCAISVAGLVFSVIFGSLVPALVGLTIALTGTTAARTMFFAIPSTFLTGAAAAGGLAFINSIGAFGGFVGPFVMGWLRDTTGSFGAGMLVIAGVMAATALLSLFLRRLMPRA
jgi:ACS family tartrate transporter-like MFS transporter